MKANVTAVAVVPPAKARHDRAHGLLSSVFNSIRFHNPRGSDNFSMLSNQFHPFYL